MIESEQVVAPRTFVSCDEQTTIPYKLMVAQAGLVFSQDPDASLCTLPLGACLGVAVYDPGRNAVHAWRRTRMVEKVDSRCPET